MTKAPSASFARYAHVNCRHAAALIAVCLACIVAGVKGNVIPVEFPAVLAVASLGLWPQISNRAMSTLQKVVGVYLCCIPLNEMALRSARFAVSGFHVDASYGIIVLVLLGLGAAVSRLGLRAAYQDGADSFPGWGEAVLVVIAHMLVLAILLGRAYGYGYERSQGVLGRVCFFYLACVALWRTLGLRGWRRSSCIALVAYYAAATAGIS